jgi:hypothetical protein
MLKPLDESDFPVAAELLAEGFPLRNRAFWDEGLVRLRRYSGNADCSVPLGHLLMAKGKAVGVALTPASLRTDPSGRRYPLINFSSWYIQPDHRWRAALFFRGVVAHPDATYVDLTPAAHVQPMLPLFGFRAVSVGLDRAATLPWSLLPTGGARVRAFRPDDALPAHSPSVEQLRVHQALGCIPVVLEHPGGTTLFVYRQRPIRRVPAARLKYVGDHAVLQKYLPALCRYLLLRGMPILSWDARPETPVPRFGYRRPVDIWYARGHIPHNCTDFIGTELCLLGI